ncbi:MAG: hypothetical protein CSB19_01955 [Clostridiales bacterium]|nr:MAG: hypothetical protein CSB19_01955 [Clostridiales bacterium]
MVRQFLSDERGSSSVLIVVMMVVLIVFGLAIFSTAMSNMRLADKKIAWKNEYYQLEGKSNRVIGDVIAIVEDVNHKKIDRKSGFTKIEQLLAESCSKYETTLGEDGLPAAIALNVTNDAGDKNIAIVLSLSQSQETNDLTIRIIEFKEWQEHFEFDDASPFSKRPSPLSLV